MLLAQRTFVTKEMALHDLREWANHYMQGYDSDPILLGQELLIIWETLTLGEKEKAK